MFAGLPGIGVGTLFYVLIALWMPLRELVNVVQGTSSLARWKVIGRQWLYAVSIIFSIMVAERLMLIILGHRGPDSLSPAQLLNRGLILRSPQSILAAPMTASLLVLGSVLLSVELFRVITNARRARRAANPEPEAAAAAADRSFGDEVLNSPQS
jgi:hypothetical protein